MKELEELTITVDADVFREVSSLCAQAGTTIEILTESFLRYCAIPENLPRVSAFLKREAAPAEAGAADQVCLDVITAVFQMAVAESIRREISDTAQH